MSDWLYSTSTLLVCRLMDLYAWTNLVMCRTKHKSLSLHECLSTLFEIARTANKQQSITYMHTRCFLYRKYAPRKSMHATQARPGVVVYRILSACKHEVVSGLIRAGHIYDTCVYQKDASPSLGSLHASQAEAHEDMSPTETETVIYLASTLAMILAAFKGDQNNGSQLCIGYCWGKEKTIKNVALRHLALCIVFDFQDTP
jgi:hypothetical protein